MGRAMLLLVSGLVIIAGIIQINNNNRSEMLPERTVDKYHEKQARNVASSLIDQGINNLLVNMDWEGTITADEQIRGEGTLTTGPDPQNPGDEYRVLLTSTGSFGGYTATTEVLMSRDSFSKYSYFTDAEKLPGGQDIWWWDGDQVTGPIHTNGTFRMSGSPTFNGDVTSPNDWVGYTGDEDSDDPAERHGSDDPQFNGDTNFNLNNPRELPGDEQLSKLANLANSDGLTFNEDVDLEFFVDENEGPDGTGYVKRTEEQSYTCGEYNNQTCTDIIETNYRLSDYNGIISIDGEANVKGEVMGQVTLHSTQQINIMGDILYHTNPIDDSLSTDMLGLVSEGNVFVDRDAHEDNGSYDLTIHASIMALETSFEVECWDQYASGCWGTGGDRGTLNLLGGIIQRNRGPVGTFSGNSVSTGFSKNYVYDERLLTTIPPSFPRESIFSMVYWKDISIERPEAED